MIGEPDHGYLREKNKWFKPNHSKSYSTADNQLVFLRKSGFFGLYRLSSIHCRKHIEEPGEIYEEDGRLWRDTVPHDCLRIAFDGIMLFEDKDAVNKLEAKYRCESYGDSLFFEELGIEAIGLEEERPIRIINIFNRDEFNKRLSLAIYIEDKDIEEDIGFEDYDSDD